MFAKLKKKIEEEAQADLSKSHSSATPSPFNVRRTGGNSRQTSPTRERRVSVSSTDSKDSSRVSNVQDIPDEISDLLRIKTEQVQKLEQRLQEYYHALQEQLDSRAKLETAVEQNQKILTSTIEKKEHEFSMKLATLEKEKSELSKKLESAKLLQNSFIEKQDVMDELEGFQTQEMAKVKHMLLNCQLDLQMKEESEKLLQKELANASAAASTLELEVKQISEKLDKQENENRKLKETESNSTQQVKELEETKQLLTDRLNKLNKDLEDTTTKCNRLEQLLSELRDENDALNHSHEVYSESTHKELEQKMEIISHLEDRISTLEKRISDSNLSSDEQYEALVLERDNLEKKLDESRHHLIEIKSNWSEKIMNLEKQIAHLNKKIAEDSQEMQRLEVAAENVKASTAKQISDLSKQLQESKANCEAMKQTHEEKEAVWENTESMLKNELESTQLAKNIFERELNDKINRLEEEILRIQNEKQNLCSNYDTRIEKLEKKCGEYISNERELRRELENVNELNLELKRSIACKEKELTSLSNTLEETSAKILELRTNVETLEVEKKAIENENSVLSARLKENEISFEKLAAECSEAKSKQAGLAADLENERKERQKEHLQLSTSLQSKSTDLENSKSQFVRLQTKLQEVEESAKSNIEKSNQVVELKKSVGNLENELIDRNKTIRLQQQRINDMKKTLQRELKMQTVLPDTASSNGEASLVDIGSSGSISDLTNSSSAVNVQFKDNHDLFHKLQSLDTSGSEPLTFDDINFKYLKHVVFKFMTCREYEAQHLVKAISVLLHFTPEEERLIRDTMDWKTSWFGSKPKLNVGQMSKKIPTT